MSANTRKIIIITLLFVGIVSGYFIYKTFWSSRCQEDDKRICALLSQLEIHDSTRIHGTYTELHNSIPLFTVEWAIDKSSQEIRRQEASGETMHLIYTDDAVYLRDYSDDKWWKQSTRIVEKFDIKLSFDPTIFFSNLVEDIQNPQTSLSYTHQDVCGAKTCYVLTMKKENKQSTQFYLDETTGQIQQVVIVDSDIEQRVKLNYEEFQIDVPSSNIKTASASQNIFFENFLQQSSVQKTKPEYVKEFEKEQTKIEQSGSPDFIVIPTTSP